MEPVNFFSNLNLKNLTLKDLSLLLKLINEIEQNNQKNDEIEVL